LIQPFIEAGNLSSQFNFDLRVYNTSPSNNGKLIALQLPAYLCPSDEAAGRKYDTNMGRSNYVACFGSADWLGPKWNGSGGGSGKSPWSYYSVADPAEWQTDGVFRLQSRKTGRGLNEIKDGTSHTAMASELRAGTADKRPTLDIRGIWAALEMGSSVYTHWLTPNSSAGDSIGVCVSSPDMPCATPSNSNEGDDYAAARSRHPGGVNVAFVDGHVEFYSDNIDSYVWRGLGTITRHVGTDWTEPLPQ
jgi:prepilin-type processing-associated H-X9-DG protein